MKNENEIDQFNKCVYRLSWGSKLGLIGLSILTSYLVANNLFLLLGLYTPGPLHITVWIKATLFSFMTLWVIWITFRCWSVVEELADKRKQFEVQQQFRKEWQEHERRFAQIYLDFDRQLIERAKQSEQEQK